VKRLRIDNDRVSYYNLLRSAFSSFLYSCNVEDFNQKYYDSSRVKFLDELYALIPSAFQRDVDALHKLQELAKIKGISYSSYDDLVEKMNRIR